MRTITRREQLKACWRWRGWPRSGCSPGSGQPREAVVPATGIGRRIRHLSYSDQGGRPDGVQVMVNRAPPLRRPHVQRRRDDSRRRRSAAAEAGRVLHRRRQHAHASPAGRRRSDAARQRRQHRGDAVVRQPARLLRERARRQHHQPQEVPLGPEHPRHLAARARCARSRSSRCPGFGINRLWWTGGRYAYVSAHFDGFTDHILCIVDLQDDHQAGDRRRAGGCPA